MKHGLKNAVVAVALLIPTLASVVAQTSPVAADAWHTAEDAGAPYHATSWVDEGTTGDTSIDAFAYVLPSGYAHCSDDPQAFWASDKSPWLFHPGDSTNVCVAITTSYDPDFGDGPLDHWKDVTLNVRDMNSSTNLSTTQSWTNPDTYVSGVTLPNDTWYSSPIPFRFDTDPLNGSSDTNKIGSFELYLTLDSHNDTTPMDSRGKGGVGDPNFWAQGYMVAMANNSGMLFGSTTDSGTDAQRQTDLSDQQGSTYGINKNMSLVRDYASSWTTPNTRVGVWAGQGKTVAWSVKPPVWTGTCGTWTSGGGCPNGGSSPWANAKNDTTELKAQVQALQNDAIVTGGPDFVTWSITHEPHDNAIDTTQGWNGGSSPKCGTSSDPSAGSSYCFGTSTEFKALYTQMRYEQQHDCNSTGGTTGTLGFPCSKVLIQYIGVPSNMTPKNGSGTSVGDGDPMRPAGADYDILGVDPYNWGCFRKPTLNSNVTTTNGSTAISTTTSGFFKSTDVGKYIDGVNLPDGVTITAFTDGQHVTISSAATASGTTTVGVHRTLCDDGTLAGHTANTEWKSLGSLMDDLSASTGADGRRLTVLGLADRLDKPVIIDEIGSFPGCDGVTYRNGCQGAQTTYQDSNYPENGRGEWFVEGLRWFEQSSLAVRYMIGFAYYHTALTYDWRFIPTSTNPSPNTEGFSAYKSGNGVIQGTGIASSFWLSSSSSSYTVNLTP